LRPFLLFRRNVSLHPLREPLALVLDIPDDVRTGTDVLDFTPHGKRVRCGDLGRRTGEAGVVALVLRPQLGDFSEDLRRSGTSP
jgi:hypothetical protein